MVNRFIRGLDNIIGNIHVKLTRILTDSSYSYVVVVSLEVGVVLAGERHGGKVRDPLGLGGQGREGGDERGGGGGGGGRGVEAGLAVEV